jgi:glycine/D-amino acid oxidase-like deaminating enzyme
MVTAAYAAWETLWRDLGVSHYAATGTLVLDRGYKWPADTAATLTAEAIPFRRLQEQDIAREYPLLLSDRFSSAIHLDTGGVLFASRIVSDLAQHLRKSGVTILQAKVRDLYANDARVVLEDGQALTSELAVVAAGPWAPRLVAGLAARVTPSRQVVVYLRPPAEVAQTWERYPMLLDLDPDAGFYLVPPRAGTGLKVGDHTFSLTGDPDRDRATSGGEARMLIERAGYRIRDIGGYMIRNAKTCFYDVAQDERFIVEPIGRSWVLSGFSGHGFKFAAVLGLELARTVAGERSAADLTAWASGHISA